MTGLCCFAFEFGTLLTALESGLTVLFLTILLELVALKTLLNLVISAREDTGDLVLTTDVFCNVSLSFFSLVTADDTTALTELANPLFNVCFSPSFPK